MDFLIQVLLAPKCQVLNGLSGLKQKSLVWGSSFFILKRVFGQKYHPLRIKIKSGFSFLTAFRNSFCTGKANNRQNNLLVYLFLRRGKSRLYKSSSAKITGSRPNF